MRGSEVPSRTPRDILLPPLLTFELLAALEEATEALRVAPHYDVAYGAVHDEENYPSGDSRVVGVCGLIFETNGLKGTVLSKELKPQALSTREVKLMC